MLGALGLGGAAAASAAQTAYDYNLACFKFNAGTQQTAAFQTQSLQLAKWRLFREDVRDLFSLTSDNLHTYMVVGTLFVGFAFYYLTYNIKDFPVDPQWLMLFFGNSALASLTFGLLGVWLAMHGVIAAHSSGVKLLTQAIRLPVPTEDEVGKQQACMADFEAAGAFEMLRFPRFWGRNKRVEAAEARIQELFSDVNGPGRSAAFQGHVRLFRQLHATYACYDAYARISIAVSVQELLLALVYVCLAHNMAKFDDRMLPRQNKPFAWSTMFLITCAALTLYKLDFYMARSRMWVLKQVVISGPFLLTLAVHLWSSNRIPGEFKCPELVWKVLFMLSNVWHLVWHVLVLYWTQPSGPRQLPVAFRSVHFTDVFGWLDDEEDLRRARRARRRSSQVGSGDAEPGGGGGGGGGGTGEEEGLGMRPPSSLGQPSMPNSLNTGLSSRSVSVLSGGSGPSQLSLELVGGGLGNGAAWSVQDSLAVNPLSSQNSSLLLPGLRGVVEEDVDTQSPPARGTVSKAVSFAATHQEVEMTHTNTHQTESATSTSGFSSFRPFEPMVRRPGSNSDVSSMPWKYFAQACLACVALWSVTTAWDFYLILTSSWQHHRTPPPIDWQASYLREVAFTSMMSPGKPFSWLSPSLTKLVFALSAHTADPSATGMASWVRDPSVAQVPTIWPHEHFRPAGIACAGNDGSAANQALLIADRFRAHAVRSPLLPLVLAGAGTGASEGSNGGSSGAASAPGALEQPLRLFPLRGITEAASWRDFALLCGVDGRGPCDSALVLEGDGRGVYQHSLAEDPFAEDAAATRSTGFWPVAPRLNATLQTMSVFTGEEAAAFCSASLSTSRDAASPPWALYAVTSNGDVVALCPLGGALEPLITLAFGIAVSKVSDMRVSGDSVDPTVLGLHVERSGALWLLLALSAHGGAELHAWAPSGAHRGAWRLPEGRTWAPGLCAAEGMGFLLAASQDTWGQASRPELWRVDISLSVPE